MMCIIKLIIKLIIIKLIIITYFNFILIILEIYIYKSNIVYMYQCIPYLFFINTFIFLYKHVNTIQYCILYNHFMFIMKGCIELI